MAPPGRAPADVTERPGRGHVRRSARCSPEVPFHASPPPDRLPRPDRPVPRPDLGRQRSFADRPGRPSASRGVVMTSVPAWAKVRPTARMTGAGVILAAGLLSACSPGASQPSSAGTSSSAPSTAAGTVDTPADTPAGGAEITTATVTDSPVVAPSPLSSDATVATDSPRPQSTEVVLSFLGWNTKDSAVEAGGYLSPVVETGCTCTLALTKDGQTVTATSPAQADASTTSCGN